MGETSSATSRSLDELMLGGDIYLEDLVGREPLTEMVESFFDLFRVPLRVFSERAGLLAEGGRAPALYGYLARFRAGRRAVDSIISEVLSLRPVPGEELSRECFTGAVYRVSPIVMDDRRIGRIVLGPFLTPDVKEVDRRLLELDADIDPAHLKDLLGKLPKARQETVQKISTHLQRTLDLLLFSGHKALLTSTMHLASVRESFKDLQDKNKELQQAYDQLKEVDRMKNNFLATVSHELRTPLTSIIGYSEMLEQGIVGEISSEQAEFVSTIHEKGKQLLEMISGLLDMAKLDSGTLKLRREEVQLQELVSDIVQTFGPMALKKKATIEADVDTTLPTLLGDKTRLRQVLTNLVDNALKFTPEGGRIVVCARATQMVPVTEDAPGMVLFAVEQPAVRLTVSDSGIGIPDSEKEKVFDPFYQVDSGTTRQVGGTGLGFSIVRRLIQGHEGTIEVQDNEPQGAKFVMVIPFRHLRTS